VRLIGNRPLILQMQNMAVNKGTVFLTIADLSNIRRHLPALRKQDHFSRRLIRSCSTDMPAMYAPTCAAALVPPTVPSTTVPILRHIRNKDLTRTAMDQSWLVEAVPRIHARSVQANVIPGRDVFKIMEASALQKDQIAK
jgi:hypothetical protein